MGIGKGALGLIACLAVVFIAAAIGSVGTSSGLRSWYDTLNKPTWQPPNWLFGPVWTLLYTLMAVALWLVLRKVGIANLPVALFAVQLLLNALWPILFFGMHLPGVAFAEIALLWVAIVATIVAFWGVSPLAGALLIPYLAWVSFATALNFTLWRMNL